MVAGIWNRVHSLPALRNASAAVTVLAVAALGAFALSDADTVITHTLTKHTTVVKLTSAPKAQDLGTAPARTTADSMLVPAAPLEASVGAPTSDPTTLAAPAVGAPTASPPAVAVAAAAPTPTPSPTSTATAPPAPAELPACPLPLSAPSPTQQGGLASLVGLSPLFGPFSSEAFAAAPLFQPLLQNFGPFLVAFADGYAAAEPSLVPLIAQVESLETSGFSVVSPIYTPYRSQFLTSEAALATALAPLVKTAAANAATSCVVDIEAVLIAAAPTS